MDYEKILSKKLVSLFEVKEDIEKAIIILEKYGIENYEKEEIRVRLAVLKLAGSNLSEMEKYTKIAKQDYRDILSWAEYPRQSKKWSMSDGSEKQKLADADRVEYETWLNT